MYYLINHSSVGNQKTVVRMDNGLKVEFPFFPQNLDGNFFSLLLSKVMGYAIILGSVVMKFHSLYFECAENLPFVVYNLVQVLGRVR